MLSLLATALAAATCLSPVELLDANRAATLAGAVPQGVVDARYTYQGQGLTGETRSLVDLATGAFIRSEAIGPIKDGDGFDGRTAWERDLSGVSSPQGGGDKPALAANQAYRNAQLWWRADRGGAIIEPIGCDGLKVTPPGGQPFEAWFDPASHRLARIRERQSFGTMAETRYWDYAPRGDEQVATRIEVMINDDATDLQTYRLTAYAIGPQRPASTYAMPRAKPADWSLPPSGRVTVPFRLLNNHIIVDARVNGRGPFPFLVDTGGHDIVTPSTLAALSLAAQGASATSGAGEKSAVSGYAAIERLDVGGAALTGQTVTTLDFSPPAVEGLQLGGMIGVEFLERFVVQIDYGAHTLSFIDPARFTPAERSEAGAAVPFSIYSHMPQVQGRFDGRSARFNIDTGSRSDVSITAPFVVSAGLRQAYPGGVTVTEGWGVGGPSRSYVVRAGELDLGSVKVAGPVAALSSAQHGSFSDASYEGNVGSGLLKRFVATFDYAGLTLYLKPTDHPDADISAFDRVGMWLNGSEGGVQVMDIAAGGPADQAGLKIGDLVTAVGGAPVLASPLSDVRRSLKLVPVGKPLTIAYQRNGVAQEARVIPRNLIPE